MAGETGRFAVNGLPGLNATFALYIVGPVLGGVIVAATSACVALFFDACGALILLAAILISAPRAVKDRDARAGGLVWAPFIPVAYSFLQPGLGLTSSSRSSRSGQPAQWWPRRLALPPEPPDRARWNVWRASVSGC